MCGDEEKKLTLVVGGISLFYLGENERNETPKVVNTANKKTIPRRATKKQI